MSRYYRAVAVDYDGTLTERDAPDPEVIAAIRRARGAGRLVVLVTGRILSSLRTSFPDAERTFDALVLENGCVIDRERILPAHTVIVSAGKIVLIAPSDKTKVPDGAPNKRTPVTICSKFMKGYRRRLTRRQLVICRSVRA